MSVSEFDIIRRYFTRPSRRHEHVCLSIGDDAAVVSGPAGYQTVLAIDTLNVGVHFFAETPPEAIAYKALAVNLSDLAAMGAEPAWFLLALSLPDAETAWLERFSAGLFELADPYRLDLIGGDTTRGPLSVTIQIGGWVRNDHYLPRSGAHPGDKLYVSGTLGDAAYALSLHGQPVKLSKADHAFLVSRLQRPSARVALGQALVGIASACIDISDGLLADAGHLLQSSGVGATLWVEALPLSAALRRAVADGRQVYEHALHGGDDYELCFTVPPSRQADVARLADKLACPLTCIGEISATPGLQPRDRHGEQWPVTRRGYDHFLA